MNSQFYGLPTLLFNDINETLKLTRKNWLKLESQRGVFCIHKVYGVICFFKAMRNVLCYCLKYENGHLHCKFRWRVFHTKKMCHYWINTLQSKLEPNMPNLWQCAKLDFCSHRHFKLCTLNFPPSTTHTKKLDICSMWPFCCYFNVYFICRWKWEHNN